jgi:hypothetical protein
MRSRRMLSLFEAADHLEDVDDHTEQGSHGDAAGEPEPGRLADERSVLGFCVRGRR